MKNKLKNAGFWIFTILVFLHFPFFIYYFIYNISSIKNIFILKWRNIIFFNYKINNCINNNFKTEKNITKNNILKNEIKNKRLFSPNKYSLIQIDANNSSNTKPMNSNIILDIYDYETALKYDKRNYWRLFYICILAKENIINLFFFKTPLDIQSLRVCLFLFTYSCDLAFNTIFFTNENISDKYHYSGNNLFIFSILNNLIQSIISSIVGLILVNIFQHMIDSRGNFEDIFREEEKKMRKNKNYKVKKKTKLKIIENLKKIFSKLKCYNIFYYYRIYYHVILLLFCYSFL